MDFSPPGSSVLGDSPGQEYWSGLPYSPPGDLPNPGIKPGFPALQADSLPAELPGKPPNKHGEQKDEAVKVLHSICQQIWKMKQWSQDWKRSVFIPIPKKGDAKECSNYPTIALISSAMK